MNDKFCKDCKHVKRSYFPSPFSPMEFAKCGIPISSSIDLVTGKKEEVFYYCSTMRAERNNYCGPEGIFFEGKL